MSVAAIRGGAPVSNESVQGEAPAADGPSQPMLPGDAIPYAMGLEFAAAALASKAAETTLKAAREGQRAAKLEQVAEQRAQADAMSDKAKKTRLQAGISGSMSIAGGAISFGAGLSQAGELKPTGRQAAWASAGSAVSSAAQPTGTLVAGGGVIDAESEANTHAARGKTAEGVAEDYASLEKQARSVIDKATSVMQALVQERQAVARAILRPT